MHPFASLLAVQDIQAKARHHAEAGRELARRPDALPLPAPVVNAPIRLRLHGLIRSFVARRSAS